jgi:roadblock/LC7 domain-containing protein
MKITVTEIREAKFCELPALCYIDFKYEVCVDGNVKTFSEKNSAEAYVEFIKEKKNDYQKVIKEIEI